MTKLKINLFCVCFIPSTKTYAQFTNNSRILFLPDYFGKRFFILRNYSFRYSKLFDKNIDEDTQISDVSDVKQQY